VTTVLLVRHGLTALTGSVSHGDVIKALVADALGLHTASGGSWWSRSR